MEQKCFYGAKSWLENKQSGGPCLEKLIYLSKAVMTRQYKPRTSSFTRQLAIAKRTISIMAQHGHRLEVSYGPQGQDGLATHRDVDPATGWHGPIQHLTGCYVVRGKRMNPPLGATLDLDRLLDPEIDQDPYRLRMTARVYLIHASTGQGVSQLLVNPEGWPLPLEDRLGVGARKKTEPERRHITFTWRGRIAISQPGWYHFQVKVNYFPEGRPKRQIAIGNGRHFRCWPN
jgi:hypothetical protein